jgi:competence protein ComEC
MFAWIPYAFVRFVLFFVAGILTGIWFPHLLTVQQALGITLFTASAFFLLVRTKWTNPGFAGLITLYAAGWLNALVHTEALQQNHLINSEGKCVRYVIVITSPAEEKENSWKHTAKVKFIYDGKAWKKVTGQVLLYFRKSSFSNPFSYGDRLIINGHPQELKPPMNPGEFDYKHFLRFRNIWHQDFVNNPNDVVFAGRHPPNLIYEAACRIRESAKKILNRYLPETPQRAVAYALLLGVTDALDNELAHAYAAAGAMHVLAVSGLHVGIIYGLILLLLRPLTTTPKGKWVLALGSIVVLWVYAVITGLSPSVLRAVTMFSFVALARPLQHRTNIYNILAASAFLLLAFNPFLIMSVGFQLSYLAVLGIVYLYPLLYFSWDAPGWLGDKIWQITCLSIAAQTGTFVLGLLYFHQFPVYFLVSNLFVIPGSTLILVSGLFLFISSSLPVMADFFGAILRILIDALNTVVTTVEGFPLALIEPVYISTPQSWMILILIVSLLLFLKQKDSRWFAVTCLSAVAVGAMQWTHFSKQIRPVYLTVYHVPGHHAFEITRGGRSYFYADSSLQADNGKIRFHIRPNRIQAGVVATKFYNLDELQQENPWFVVSCNHIRILYVSHPSSALPAGFFDYVILGKDALPDYKLPESLSFGKIILDSTLQGSALYRFEQLAQAHGWNMHAVIRQGAFHVKL